MAAKTLLVTIVSEQTVPNVQFCKWFLKNHLQNMDVIFISTEKMENQNKSADIQKALGPLSNWFSFELLIVKENDIQDIREKIKKEINAEKYGHIVANITGGTKLMSIGLFEICREWNNSEIYYQPIGRNLKKIFPDYDEFEIDELLTLDEYMKAYGIQYKMDNSCLKDFETSRKIYETIIKNNRELIRQLVSMQNTPYFKNIFKQKKSVDITAIDESVLKTEDGTKVVRQEFCDLLDAFGFDKTKLKRRELFYLCGGWFEEYVYQKIKTERNVKDENIALNMSIQKGNDKNELDVVWLDKDNRLNVAECKSFLEGSGGNKVLNDALYKLQAIMKSKFGLHAVSYLYTKSNLDGYSALSRAKEFGIKITAGENI